MCTYVAKLIILKYFSDAVSNALILNICNFLSSA